jgi:hypothetical protein
VQEIQTISTYLRRFSNEIGEQVVSRFPPLHRPGDEASPSLKRLKRKPFPGQELAIMGIVKAWTTQSGASAIAECGTGKTLIALASIYAHAQGRGFTAVAMVPPQLVLKWARECFLTIPGVRVFLIDGLRNGVGSNGYSGVNEVRISNGHVPREGLKTTLTIFAWRRHTAQPVSAGASCAPDLASLSSRGNEQSSAISGGTRIAFRVRAISAAA